MNPIKQNKKDFEINLPKEKIDLLLVVPPYEENYGFVKEVKMCEAPLGLAYMASYAEKQGYKVKLQDFDALSLEVKDIIPQIIQFSPNVVGITCTTALMGKIIRIIELIKQVDKNIIVVVGGPHVCALPKETLKISKADIAVVGEGEETIIDILKYVNKKIKLEDIKGIVYKNKGKIIFNKPRELIEDLDKIPFPARHLLRIDKYKAPFHLSASEEKFCNLIATRGCPYHCIFCGQSIVFKNKVRKRSVKNVVDEIEFLIKKYDVKTFFFEDSTFVVYTDFVEGVCKEIINRNLKIKWGCNGRVNLANKKLLQLMRKAGCMSVFYGVESGNQDILDRIKKATNLNQIKTSIMMTKKAGISVNASFILGLPGETKKTIEDTIRFAIALNPDFVSFSLATPYPGTEFYHIALKEGYNLDDWSVFENARYGEALYVPKGMTKKELKKLYSRAYKRFYLRPKYVLKTLSRIRSFSELTSYAKIGLSLLKKNN